MDKINQPNKRGHDKQTRYCNKNSKTRATRHARDQANLIEAWLPTDPGCVHACVRKARQPLGCVAHPGVADLHELLAVQVDGPHDGIRVVLDQPVLAHLLHLRSPEMNLSGGRRGAERRSVSACISLWRFSTTCEKNLTNLVQKFKGSSVFVHTRPKKRTKRTEYAVT